MLKKKQSTRTAHIEKMISLQGMAGSKKPRLEEWQADIPKRGVDN